MIYPDKKIIEWASNGGIRPYTAECVNPASVDLRWSGRYRAATPDGWGDVVEADELILLPAEKPTVTFLRGLVGILPALKRFIQLPPEPVSFYLLDTTERVIMPPDAGGILMLKSSAGRLGLEHSHAGFFDPEFDGTATLEMSNIAPWPVVIKKNQRIVQLVLNSMSERPFKTYQQTGRYNGQYNPQPPRN